MRLFPFLLLCSCLLYKPAAARQFELQDTSFALPVPDSIVPISMVRTDSFPAPEIRRFAVAESKPVSLRSVLIPTAMIAYGAFTIGNKDLTKINEEVQEMVWGNRAGGERRTIKLDNITLMAPAAAVYALNFAGVTGKHNFIDRSFLYGISNLIGTGITSSVKRMTRVMRPDSSNRLSFPSGHTSKAFIAAEFLRQEYKHRSAWYGVAGYAVAIGTGFLRMYNNKHWLNDVVAGAGVGILSTRISYWLYPKIKDALFPKYKGDTVVLPTYQEGAVGFGLVHRF